MGRGRHDPCVLPRAVPIVESMMALVLADHTLRQRAQVGGLDDRRRSPVDVDGDSGQIASTIRGKEGDDVSSLFSFAYTANGYTGAHIVVELVQGQIGVRLSCMALNRVSC